MVMTFSDRKIIETKLEKAIEQHADNINSNNYSTVLHIREREGHIHWTVKKCNTCFRPQLAHSNPWRPTCDRSSEVISKNLSYKMIGAFDEAEALDHISRWVVPMYAETAINYKRVVPIYAETATNNKTVAGPEHSMMEPNTHSEQSGGRTSAETDRPSSFIKTTTRYKQTPWFSYMADCQGDLNNEESEYEAESESDSEDEEQTSCKLSKNTPTPPVYIHPWLSAIPVDDLDDSGESEDEEEDMIEVELHLAVDITLTT